MAALDTRPEDLSTLMYTSGSTGTPKGAMFNERKWHNHVSHPCKFLHTCSFMCVLLLESVGIHVYVSVFI